MATKGDRLKALYAQNHVAVSTLPPNNSQKTHTRRLQTDISRTNTFIHQAEDAIQQLTKTLGPLAEKTPNINTSLLPAGWSAETWRMAHLVALHEVYKQLPYSPMKNDSIGMASAVKMTQDAVREQRESSDMLEAHNDASAALLSELQAILTDYQEMEAALALRVAQYPQKLAQLEQKIRDSGSYLQEIDRKISSVAEMLSFAKAAEERMYGHMQRVVMKLHALVDWENANMMDEATFRKSISSSVILLHTMVQRLMENGGDSEANWVRVSGEVAEVRLMEVMIRNNVIVARGSKDRLEVKLLDLGV